jgi:hypothetical protein
VASSLERDGRLAYGPQVHTTNSDGECAAGLLGRCQGRAGFDPLTLTDARASEPGVCS